MRFWNTDNGNISYQYSINHLVDLNDINTSSLDALNEGVILKSIKAKAKDKTVILVSHRESTMRIADSVLEF